MSNNETNEGTFIIERLAFEDSRPEIMSMVVRWDQTYDQKRLENLYRQTERMLGVEQVACYRYAMVVHFFPHVVRANDLASDLENLVSMLGFHVSVAIFIKE